MRPVATKARWRSGFFLPRLEMLEDRIYPGDTLLGIWALGLWGSSFACQDGASASSRAPYGEWQHGHTNLDGADAFSAILLLSDSHREGDRGGSVGDRAAVTAALETSAAADTPLFADDNLARQLLLHPMNVALWPESPGRRVDFIGTAAGLSPPWSGIGEALLAAAAAGNGEQGGPSAGLWAARRGGPNLSFDTATGQLAIRPDPGDHTIRAALASDGFMEVTLDGQAHSSNPRSASFDSALGGATGATVAGLRFDGGGQDTLILGSQRLSGGFAVRAAGALVVTENVVTAGPLAIQAPNITVRGALQGTRVDLAAAGWVTVDGAGRIDAVPSQGRAGDVRPPSTITVAAGVFVNSGQLHADGPTGGQIRVQAGNVLNAGPITANGTDSGGNAGQVHIAFTDAYVATTAALMSASSAAGPGGHLTIDGGRTGHLFSSGRHLATGSVGGAVDLFGRDVVLAGAMIDASGEAGGGSVRLGGDFHGGDPAVLNAETVTVTPASTIRADALQSGSGGRVSVRSEQTTAFDGALSARGGTNGGPGGFIEVSGHGDLSYGGSADAGARLGQSGTLLLDPKNITISAAPVGVFPQFDLIDPHPTAGGGFGAIMSVLSSGNVVVTNSNDDFGGAKAGADYMFDGLSGTLVSSLVGSHPNDQVGFASGVSPGVTLLSNGNYVIPSSNWNDQRGAVTWGDGRTGVSGTITDTNSLVGSSRGDKVGIYSANPLSNGNYVVRIPTWNGNRGAVTWGNGSTGTTGAVSDANSLVGSNPWDLVGAPYFIPLSNGNYLVITLNWNGNRGAVTWSNGNTGTTGTISDVNSLVGSHPDDRVGLNGITLLNNGNYLVQSQFWNRNRGAVTWGNGNAGVSGVVSEANSLVGSHANDYLGESLSWFVPSFVPLSNGNYVIVSPMWNGNRGAVTWGNGSTGTSGIVSDANSVVGSKPGNASGAPLGDLVGQNGVTLLSNGNYVIASPSWNSYRGAATWGNGSTGVSGAITNTNSLVGSNPVDFVAGSVIPLSNGNYVIGSSHWNGKRGAATWANGGMGISGTISDANSLVGSNPNDQVGISVTALSNGNYVVTSPLWDDNRGAVTWGNGGTGATGTVSDANSLVGSNPNDSVGGITPLSNGNYVIRSLAWNGNRGAVTWGNGSTGTTGPVSDANSLVGARSGDLVGYNGVTELSNGNYVVESQTWSGNRGAVTWCNGSTGTTGIVSDANSLVGSNPNDQVGNGGYSLSTVTALNNGNYVFVSQQWNEDRGAVTWCNGSTGTTGIVSDANSLVGGKPRDLVGYNLIIPLNNDNFLVLSSQWNSQRGAVTWGSGQTGIRGVVSAANSVVGSYPNDRVGAYSIGGIFTPLNGSNFVILSRSWSGNRGAVTWVDGTTGRTLNGDGTITAQNSLIGRAPDAGLGQVLESPVAQMFLAGFGTEGTGRIAAGLVDPNLLTYAVGQSQTVTITPAFVSRTLETGTAVFLQASNDITVNSPITVNAGGHGGSLTLQAGRSIVLNAPISTNNGALTLLANDPLANGVVDTQRDSGNAVITMAPGTALDTGSGTLTVEVRDGAGLTNRDSGVLTLQTVTAGSVSVLNKGPSAGSDVKVGAVTTGGSQYYASPNGTTRVTGNLTAADSSITFTDSLVVHDDVTVTAGANAIYFVGSSTQTLQSGSGTRFGNVNHTATGTLQLTSGLTVTGSFINAAGTFDANDQPVTVAGSAAILSGSYLAGTAPQSFHSGLALAHGVFTSSTGPMSVTGGIRLLGGSLSGVGTVDTITARGGAVAPGGTNPGVLVVAGAVAFDPATTLSILLKGADAGTGYSQLAIGGPIDLGGSTLALNFGFEPPVGSRFEVVTDTGSAPIAGTFKGLDEGAIFTQGGYQFQITYRAGTGVDSVVVTRLV